MATLESAIDALYQLPLDEFTAARGALAREQRGPDAARVKHLKKPTAVPWAVNQVYWRARPAYHQLVQRGQALRAAQVAALKGRSADVRGASVAHREAVSAAVRTAVDIASRDSLRPDAELLARMFEAISLAAKPPERPGRCTEVLRPAAFDALTGITPAVRATTTSPPPEPQRPSAAFNAATRAVTRARAAVASAREKLESAEAELEQAQEAERAARKRRGSL